MSVRALGNPKSHRNLVKKCPNFPRNLSLWSRSELDSLLPPKSLWSPRQPAVIVAVDLIALIALCQTPVTESRKKNVNFFVKQKLQGFVWVLACQPCQLQARISRNKKKGLWGTTFYTSLERGDEDAHVGAIFIVIATVSMDIHTLKSSTTIHQFLTAWLDKRERRKLCRFCALADRVRPIRSIPPLFQIAKYSTRKQYMYITARFGQSFDPAFCSADFEESCLETGLEGQI